MNAYAKKDISLAGFSPAEMVKFEAGQIPGTVMVHGNLISVAIPKEVFTANFMEVK